MLCCGYCRYRCCVVVVDVSVVIVVIVVIVDVGNPTVCIRMHTYEILAYYRPILGMI